MNTDRQDSNAGSKQRQGQSWIYDNGDGTSNKITCNAQTGLIEVEVITTSTGERDATLGSMQVKVADLLGKRITARETKSCDDEGNPVYCVMLRSAFYDTPVGSDFT